ncbi:imm11 family protein [Paenibacillus ferrarius]|uniref:imm11 family protein n=1 Tax=Paenibacillus ferrarius TaxID=1469647 RepID=UPI003D2DD5DD
MKVWMLTGMVDRYETITFEDVENSLKLIKGVGTGSMLSSWSPINTIPARAGLRNDFHVELTVPVVSEKALNIIRSMIEGEAEFLPLIHPKENYYILNVCNILNCLDSNRVEYTTFSTGKVKKYTKLAFRPEIISKSHIFKTTYHDIPDVALNQIFVSNHFRNVVMESGLCGFYFTEVWED